MKLHFQKLASSSLDGEINPTDKVQRNEDGLAVLPLAKDEDLSSIRKSQCALFCSTVVFQSRAAAEHLRKTK